MAGKRPSQPGTPTPASGGGYGDNLKCVAGSCKAKPERFGFCSEHYDHFKFGLVTKSGAQVPDYDKKIDHYIRLQERQKKSA